jgi:hypothetical protein
VSRRRAALAALLTALALAAPRAARAQPSTDDRAAAEALFEEGKALVAKSELAPACERFAESHRLDPQIGTLLYLATCREQTGKTASAWADFKEALALAEKTGKTDRLEQARQGVDRTSTVLSRISVKLAWKVEGLRVTINGREVRMFDTALPYDPGSVAVVAEAPGRKTFTRQLTLEKGPTAIEVVIPELEVLPKGDGPAPEREADHTVAFAVGGAGLGLVAVGMGFGLGALLTKSAADDHCRGSFCDQEGLDGHDRANVFAWTANVTVGAGLAAVATGIVLFIVEPIQVAPGSSSAGALIVPAVAAGASGPAVGVAGRF